MSEEADVPNMVQGQLGSLLLILLLALHKLAALLC